MSVTLAHWGVIDDIEEDILPPFDLQSFLGPIPATWHILNFSEEVRLTAKTALSIKQSPDLAGADEQTLEEARRKIQMGLRVIYSIRSMRGKPIQFGQADPEEEIQARLRWLAGHPGPLVEAMLAAYKRAEKKPLVALQKAIDDLPNFVSPTSAPSGASTTTSGTSEGASSAARKRPTSPSTSSLTDSMPASDA